MKIVFLRLFLNNSRLCGNRFSIDVDVARCQAVIAGADVLTADSRLKLVGKFCKSDVLIINHAINHKLIYLANSAVNNVMIF